jgi:ParB/RepB/Spo0J family partition protein
MTTEVSTTADATTVAPATPNGETAPKKNGNGHKVSHVILFSKIEISKWNRSYGVALDDDYIKSLADDIDDQGLLHPVTLVKTADGEGYRIVAGANRTAALRKLRGDYSGLKQTEFKVLEDMDEDNKACLEVSLSENHHRRDSSVYEQAIYVDRLVQEQKFDQGKVATLLKFDRPKVNRLQKLAKEFSKLPECWQKDLKTSPSSPSAKGVVVTFTHWYEVAGLIGEEGELTPKLLETLVFAHANGYSTRTLKEEVKKVLAGGDVPKREDKTKVVPKASSLCILKHALEGLREAAEGLEAGWPDESAELEKVVVTVEEIVEKLEADKQAKADAAEKVKEAEAEVAKQKREAAKREREAKVEEAKREREAAKLKREAAKREREAKAQAEKDAKAAKKAA